MTDSKSDKSADKPAEKRASAPRKRKPKVEEASPQKPRLWRVAVKWALRGLGGIAALYAVLILLFSFVPPPINLYQMGESWRLGGIEQGLGQLGRDCPGDGPVGRGGRGCEFLPALGL